jgi:hypothetical protein
MFAFIPEPDLSSIVLVLFAALCFTIVVLGLRGDHIDSLQTAVAALRADVIELQDETDELMDLLEEKAEDDEDNDDAAIDEDEAMAEKRICEAPAYIRKQLKDVSDFIYDNSSLDNVESVELADNLLRHLPFWGPEAQRHTPAILKQDEL